uniref:Uncharacterized protein n=1 Tax=Coccidioides posadasii RMSCC 3488 TaxID=454284 RepID=A0A0J6FG38_COCPO|nr:hypothetical protein CPAG_05569 [Coccidioides posadasii RMSCC 3488]
MRGFIARSIILVRWRRNSVTTSRFVIKNSKHMHDGPYQQQPAYFLRPYGVSKNFYAPFSKLSRKQTA